jgi:hypothetical protein
MARKKTHTKKRGGNAPKPRKYKRSMPLKKKLKRAAQVAGGLYLGRKLYKDYQWGKKKYPPLEGIEKDIIKGVRSQIKKIPVKEMQKAVMKSARKGYERVRYGKDGRQGMIIG